MKCNWGIPCDKPPTQVIICGCINMHIHTRTFCYQHTQQWHESYKKGFMNCSKCDYSPITDYEETLLINAVNL
jgi:hypothetical protein